MTRSIYAGKMNDVSTLGPFLFTFRNILRVLELTPMSVTLKRKTFFHYVQ